ncbi:MAG: dihydroorotase [Salibacteraceae bacterium]
MKTLIKNAKLIYPGHPKNGKVISVLINKGSIDSINPKESAAKRVIDAKGMLLFPALVDTFCHSGEPGFEEKEDFHSLTSAARSGGFSRLCILPNTSPVIDSKSNIKFILSASGQNGVYLHPVGSITKSTEGQELSEMFDMHQSGAIAFSDGKIALADVNMMKRALDYVRSFNGLLISYPMDERVAPGGMVNESAHNTGLGLKSTPDLAEELMVNRDLYLLKYTQSRLHISGISTKGSIELIEKTKKEGQNISAGVSLAHLLFNETQLSSFDTNFKITPPLRTESDRKALIQALKKGVINTVHSDHSPENIEQKDVEFDQAAYGMTMLETALSAYNMYLSKEITWDEFILAFSLNPRNILGLKQPELEKGSEFEFCLFNPKEKWKYNKKTLKSKSSNSPFFEMELVGKAIEV